MFEPEHKSHLYLLLVLIVAIFLGWSVYTQYRPMLIKASCSEIAASSSGFIYKEKDIFEPSYSYESIKSKCMQDNGL